MISLDVVDARIRKCKDVTILVDKKMRERKIVHDKYIIHLDRNNPFEVDEFVKITRKNDFEKIVDDMDKSNRRSKWLALLMGKHF